MKKKTSLIGLQTIALTLLLTLPAQAAINIGAPVTTSGSIVTLHSNITGSWTPVTSVIPGSTPTPIPVQTTTTPSTPSAGTTGTPSPSSGSSVITIKGSSSGNSVVSLKNYQNPQSTSSVPVSSSPATTPTPAQPTTTTPSIPPATSLTADEQNMVDMVNQQRAAAGLKPLTVDLRLVAVARAKANDMQTNHYFDHTSPTYGSPWAMMQLVGLKVQWAGENIGGNVSVSGAMSAWMQSPGHRANILDPKFTHIGVGAAYGAPYNIYVQEFLQE